MYLNILTFEWKKVLTRMRRKVSIQFESKALPHSHHIIKLKLNGHLNIRKSLRFTSSYTSPEMNVKIAFMIYSSTFAKFHKVQIQIKNIKLLSFEYYELK